ncbi:hypothetical protein HZU40_05975 [Mycolicibacterium fluoranthenivorans]|uniref:Uncharacterized protein n=1 Tax=Mycolicibacterium fluoranthenivorans TaxID=258505 RepID=A0A7G8PHP1_9MYCO|nr:hypothetical protein [Mycolicibacterium fluoranthenivorans]QNJ93857.1 hypothetical protein HZU40_05975 [Mycolicibacterium fluoranthenivorans]
MLEDVSGLKIIDVYSAEDTEVTVVAEVRGNGFNGPSTFTFPVADNKVTEMPITA